MTSIELRDWIARMGFSRREAADALGIRYRTIESYLREKSPVAIWRPIELLAGCLEREAARKE